MNFDGIEIDMLFAKLTLKEIPDSMVNNILYLHKKGFYECYILQIINFYKYRISGMTCY